MIICGYDSGFRAVFDGNRLADHAADNPRLTMGEAMLEGEGGSTAWTVRPIRCERTAAANGSSRAAGGYRFRRRMCRGACRQALEAWKRGGSRK